MAVINTTHGFVFVHVPKSAGTSVSHALSALCTPFDLEIGGTPYGEAMQKVITTRWPIYKHSLATELRRSLGAQRWARMTTFSIVRNPYDRAYSTYKYLLQHKKERPVMAGFKTFSAFVESDWWNGEGPDRLLMPQSLWTHVKSDQIVDAVGKVETLADDLSRILGLAGVPPIKLQAIAPPRENVSHAPKAKPVLSEKGIAKLRKRYERDFALFGYDAETVPFSSKG